MLGYLTRMVLWSTIENGLEESMFFALQMEPIQYLVMVEIIKARFMGNLAADGTVLLAGVLLMKEK